MTTDVTVFENKEFGKVRTLVIDDEPWFVGKDVAEALGYANPSEALQDHVDEEDKLNSKTLSSCELKLGQRGGWVINESGLYSLILSSKIPSAKKFKRWVTAEVLPSLRRTGGFVLQKPDSYMIEDPVERAQRWTEEYKEKLALQDKIAKDAPKVEIYDHFLGGEGCMTISECAKLWGVTRNELFSFLYDHGFCTKDTATGKWVPTAEHKYDGMFEVKWFRPWNSPNSNPSTYITREGREILYPQIHAEKLAGQLTKCCDVYRDGMENRRRAVKAYWGELHQKIAQ